MIRHFLALSLVACVVAAVPAANAEERTHDGFYMRLGAGYGYLTTSVDPGAGTVKGGGTAWQFAAGGTPIPGLVIAGQLFTHIQSKPTFEQQGFSGTSDKTLFWLGLGPMVDYYLDPKGGVHFGGSLLYSTFNGVNYTSTGAGVGVHGGYDFFFSDSWSVGPTLQVIYSSTNKDPEKDKSLSIAVMITLLDH